MAYLLAALLLGSLVYCVLVIVAVGKYRAVRPSPPATFPAISILKPLEGLDEGLESNLRTFFEQNYPNYEILFAMRTSDDPAYALVNRLGREYSHISSRVLLVGEFPPWPNRKVWSLNQMMAEAANDLLVMSDSDIRVTPSMLETLAAEFADPKLAVTTCPYRAVPGNSFWSKLEALGMNTEFLGGIMVARMLEGMRFAVGPTIAARRAKTEYCLTKGDGKYLTTIGFLDVLFTMDAVVNAYREKDIDPFVETWPDPVASERVPISLVIEVKASKSSISEAIRQIELYRQFYTATSASRCFWVLVTLFPITASELSLLKTANIWHAQLGEDFEDFCISHSATEKIAPQFVL